MRRSKLLLTILAIPLAVMISGGLQGGSLALCDPSKVSYDEAEHRWTIGPTGSDDTCNIQTAFDMAVASGEESVIHLTGGRFFTGNILVDDFRGRLEGEGPGVTILDTLRSSHLPGQSSQDWQMNPTVPGIQPTPGVDAIDDWGGQYVFWFGFRNGDVTVTNLTFHPTAFYPADLWVHGRWGVMQTGVVSLRMLGEEIDSVVDNVEFLDSPGEMYYPYDGFEFLHGTNVDVHLLIAGNHFVRAPKTYADMYDPDPANPRPFVFYNELLRGSHRVTRSEFHGGFASVFAFSIADGELVMGGTPPEGNTIEGSWYQVGGVSGSNAAFVFSHNDFKNAFAAQAISAFMLDWVREPGLTEVPVNAIEELWGGPSNFVAEHNEIHVSYWERPSDGARFDANGILTVDYHIFELGTPGAEFDFARNHIELDGTQYGGIACSGVESCVVTNNRVSGTGDYGIGFFSSSQSTAVGNNLKKVSATTAPLLLVDSSDCTVVGGVQESDMLDIFGEDNVCTGVNNMNLPPNDAEAIGQRIRETMSKKYK